MSRYEEFVEKAQGLPNSHCGITYALLALAEAIKSINPNVSRSQEEQE